MGLRCHSQSFPTSAHVAEVSHLGYLAAVAYDDQQPTDNIESAQDARRSHWEQEPAISDTSKALSEEDGPRRVPQPPPQLLAAPEAISSTPEHPET